MLEFEWDAEKDRSNQAKHGISFVEASTVFGDPLAQTMVDPRTFEREYRFVTVGYTSQQQLIVVWHAERDDRVRIIGARRATPREQTVYESKA